VREVRVKREEVEVRMEDVRREGEGAQEKNREEKEKEKEKVEKVEEGKGRDVEMPLAVGKRFFLSWEWTKVLIILGVLISASASVEAGRGADGGCLEYVHRHRRRHQPDRRKRCVGEHEYEHTGRKYEYKYPSSRSSR
jgi:hypothetical protein